MINVLIADDHPVIRAGLRQILENAGGIRVDKEAGDGNEALAAARSGRYDVLVLDIGMPGLNGLEVLKRIRSESSKLPILVLSVYAEEYYALRVVRAGASGYLTKEIADDELVQAVRTVASGKRYVSASLAEKLAEAVDRSMKKPSYQALSDRELEVFKLLAAGRTMKEIADALHVGITTASTYRARILGKMSMKSNAEIIRYAIEHRLTD